MLDSYMNDIKSLDNLFKHQNKATKKYGDINSYELLLLKRSINTAVSVVATLDTVSFDELEIALYFKETDEDVKKLIKAYEYQMEGAKLNSEKFIEGLHGFYMKMIPVILANVGAFFSTVDLLNRVQKEKKDYQSIYDSYISLLLQQASYLCYFKGNREQVCCGLTTNNEIIFKDSIYPYSDQASYELERELYNAVMKGKEAPSFSKIKASYKKWGYDINSMADIQLIEATTRLFDNNHYMMMNYINEHTVNMLPNKIYRMHTVNFPRVWMPTEVLLEKLQKRKYCLPSSGVVAKYYNAGEIEEIHFQEIYKNGTIILLYKVFGGGCEFSGVFDTKTHYFWSIFERSTLSEYHDLIENFILENYYTLTCEPTIDKKKLSILMQVDDINKDHFENYGRQPVVCYMYNKKQKSYKTNEVKTFLHHYDRNNYKSEKASVNGYIRRLPEGQTASSEAKQFAIQLGYELADNETYVRPFEKHVLRIKEV